jgi:hypothetical protein
MTTLDPQFEHVLTVAGRPEVVVAGSAPLSSCSPSQLAQ